MSKEATALNEESIFLGNVEVKVDMKGRVAVPESFMKVLKKIVGEEEANKVGVAPGTDGSLKLMPYPQFMNRLAYWMSLNEDIEEQRDVRNFALSLAKVHPLDAQNRLRLTPGQMQFCRIEATGDAVVVGNGGDMKLMDAKKYSQNLTHEMSKFAKASEAVAKAALAAQTPLKGS